jgi:serine/threonine protein kinase
MGDNANSTMALPVNACGFWNPRRASSRATLSHCKPATNVFILWHRVEDDNESSTFPFNSCGTAAYVAPEALACSKKVNSSVDVYAFGIMMWELLVGEPPYRKKKQQQIVMEVGKGRACWNIRVLSSHFP